MVVYLPGMGTAQSQVGLWQLLPKAAKPEADANLTEGGRSGLDPQAIRHTSLPCVG